MARKLGVYKAIGRLAFVSWMVTKAKEEGWPAPAGRERESAAYMKEMALHILDQLEGGNNEENRRKLFEVVAALRADIDANPDKHIQSRKRRRNKQQ